MHTGGRLAIAAAALTTVSAYTPCPILGPVFPAPSSLGDANIFQAALKNISATLDYAGKTGITPYGSIPSNATSFTVGVFSADETLFSHQYTSPWLKNSTQGATEVGVDSVFRIGSGSKLITTYLWLVEVGMKYWGHSITEFVPELAEAARNCVASANPVDCINWDEITLGALASHMAGVPRDYSTPLELLTQVVSLPPQTFGAPTLPASTFPPCGYNFTNACTEEQYADGLAAAHPIYAPYTTPIYSNAAFELLGFALANITGRTFPDMLQKDLFDKLHMTDSSYFVPKNLTNAVMPGGPVKSFFVADVGGETPDGGMYSSQADLIKMGQSILNASLLSPTTIRQWMKPSAFTNQMNTGIGMPWEIWRKHTASNHIVDLYTKSGDLFSYSSHFVLIPDYKIGYVILAAGNQTTSTVEQISDIMAAKLVAALGDTARSQAQAKYAGVYKSANVTQASNMTLTTTPGEPGLVVKSWYSQGVNLMPVIAQLFVGALTPVDVRMYPTNLVQQVSPTKQRISYRLMVRALAEKPNGGLFSSDCEQWAMVDSKTYGDVGLDEVVFEVENGKATTVSPRAWRAVYNKTESVGAYVERGITQ